MYFKVSIQKKPVVYGRVAGRQAEEETMTMSTIAVNAASHTGRKKCLWALFIEATLKYKVNCRNALPARKYRENDEWQPGNCLCISVLSLIFNRNTETPGGEFLTHTKHISPCKVLIVEDESLVAMDMTDMLVRLGYDVLPAAMDYTEAIKALETWEPGMVLIDINLGGSSSGMDVARHIAATKDIPFIFVSSHSDRQTVSTAALLEPSGYLLKPFDANDLYACMEVALAGFAARKGQGRKGDAALQDSIFIKTDRHFVKVKVAEILYLESEHNYIFVHALKGKYIVRSSFKEFLLNMPADRFIQVHKSFVVSLDRIDNFSHTDITINKRQIPLSRMYKEDFFAKMHRVQ